MQNLSKLFFDCVEAISSWNGKGALLKRVKHIIILEAKSVLCPIEEQPLDFVANSASYNGSEVKDDGVLVILR